MQEISRESIVEAAKRASQEVDGPLSRNDFERVTGISQYHIYKEFPRGGWTQVKKLAGLERHPKDNEPLTDEELLEEYYRVASEIGEIPTWPLFAAHASVSADVVRRRFGGLQGTLRRFRAWLETHHADSPLLGELQLKSDHEVLPPPTLPRTEGPAEQFQWEKMAGPEFGTPINFRGLRHAPINEQGVVFLFGMISYELGFIVEAIHAAYPDCEAKRCLDPTRNRWQRVRIEFEYLSRNFRDHGHDPSRCDIIVCWEHNWPECPLEVIVLRRLIDDLEG